MDADGVCAENEREAAWVDLPDRGGESAADRGAR